MIDLTQPPWFAWSMHELGTREEPGNRGPAIQRYINLSHCGAQGEPWCAIFVNAALESNGIPGTRSPGSQSFRHDNNFVQLSGPALGAIVVFWRIGIHSGLGHVGFYRGERGNYIYTLGGNENDEVEIEPLAKEANAFGLVGFYWPAKYPMPTIGPIIMDADTPSHITKVT